MKTKKQKTDKHNANNGSNKEKRNVFQDDFWMLKKIWHYTPGYIIWMIIEGVVWGVNNSIDIFYMQKLFNALGERAAFQGVAGIILAYGAYLLLFYIFHYWYWQIYNPKISEKLHIAMHTDMFRQAVAIDLARYDEPKFYNDFVWAMEESFNHARGLMEDTGKLINRVIASLTLTGILFSVDAAMAVIIFLQAVIQIALSFMDNKISAKYKEAVNPLERKAQYIKRVFKLPDYAKEIRITEVSDKLFEELDRNTEEKKGVIQNYKKKSALLKAFMSGFGIIWEMGLMILILYKIMVTGEVELGGFAVAINGCWRMEWLLRDLTARLMKYHEHGLFIEKMISFMEMQPNIRDGRLEADAFQSLEIKSMAFSYDWKQENSVLKKISLTINRGERIALVGYNGAGKTTLTKLLMRLYDPTEGEILYNGKDLKEYTLSSLRNRIAAVFQDYKIFACSLAENVVGGAYSQKDKAEVEAALEKSAFGDKLASLKSGIQTELTREFNNSGTQFSGGEQQKVAIARAFFKQADLIILDEPSSALDPIAEYELNQSISAYAEARTVIFISHRLSTTRHADRIYMFDKGRIVESGTHEELMALDGKYAYMFRLQAEKYQEANA